MAALTQAQLDALPAAAGALEDVYPLSPMQSGLLFHTLYSASSRLYVNQLCAEVDGLDPVRLGAAWQAVTDAHPALRTAFVTPDDGGEPLQMVMRRVAMPVALHDWRGRDAQDTDLQALALTERARGFDLAVAPCQRLVLVRLDERRWHLIWSYHHLLLDGWSVARMLAEVLSRYRAEHPARLPQAPAGKYADYIAWRCGGRTRTARRNSGGPRWRRCRSRRCCPMYCRPRGVPGMPCWIASSMPRRRAAWRSMPSGSA